MISNNNETKEQNNLNETNSYKNKKNKINPLIIVIIIAILATGIYFVANSFDDAEISEDQNHELQSEVDKNVELDIKIEEQPIDMADQTTETDSIIGINPKNNEEESLSVEENTEDIAQEETPYDYSKKVPLSYPVNNSYFEDAVFIGNSQVEGISLYGPIKETTVYAQMGIMVNTIFSKEVIRLNSNTRVTIMEALVQREFGKIYIMLGANELGWRSDEEFIEAYEKVIDELKAIQPNAIIYICSIMPVSKEKSDRDPIYNNTNIDRFNSMILELAQKKEVYYVDSKSAVGDAEGNLPEEAGTDGVHLNSDYYTKWFDYLKTHTVGGNSNEENIGKPNCSIDRIDVVH